MEKRIKLFEFSVTEKEYEKMIKKIKEDWEFWKDCYDYYEERYYYDSYEEFEEDRLYLMFYPD